MKITKVFLIYFSLTILIKNDEIKITKKFFDYKLELLSKSSNLFFRPKDIFLENINFKIYQSNFFNPINLQIPKSTKLMKFKIVDNCLFPLICSNTIKPSNFTLKNNNLLDFNCELINFENQQINLHNTLNFKDLSQKISADFFILNIYDNNLKQKFINIFCAVFEDTNNNNFSYEVQMLDDLIHKDFLIDLNTSRYILKNDTLKITLEKNSESSIHFLNILNNFEIDFMKTDFKNIEIKYENAKSVVSFEDNKIKGDFLDTLNLTVINKNYLDYEFEIKIKGEVRGRKNLNFVYNEIIIINMVIIFFCLLIIFNKKILEYFEKYIDKKTSKKFRISSLKSQNNCNNKSKENEENCKNNSKLNEKCFVSLKFGNSSNKELSLDQIWKKKIKDNIFAKIHLKNNEK